jgi:hypothetical protein
VLAIFLIALLRYTLGVDLTLIRMAAQPYILMSMVVLKIVLEPIRGRTSRIMY